MKFRSRVVEIDAEQWFPGREVRGVDIDLTNLPYCRTKHGDLTVSAGDWIIAEMDGSGYFPCDASTFEAKYEPVPIAGGSDLSPQEAMDGSPALVVRTLGDLTKTGKFAGVPLDENLNFGQPAASTAIHIRFQCGPLKEVGVNGCSIEDVIDVLAERLRGFQAGPFACPENERALTRLYESKHALLSRTAKRVEQGVEGTNQAHES